MRDTLWCGVIQRQCDGSHCKNCHMFPKMTRELPSDEMIVHFYGNKDKMGVE